jgi:hypothetical protein
MKSLAFHVAAITTESNGGARLAALFCLGGLTGTFPLRSES